LRIFLWIFTISFLLRIWFNFFVYEHNAVFACDAAEYLRHAQNILLVFNSLLATFPHSCTACINNFIGHANTEDISFVKQIFSPLQSMSISGPVFPVFILLCFKVFGENPSFQAWASPVIVQSIMSALTCVLIASIGRVCWSQTVGIAAGLIAAFYPGFIINSGRLYSESFACFLLCSIIWLLVNYLVKDKNNYFWGLLLGISLFALQTTRSIMSILTLIIIVFFIISSIFLADKQKQIVKYLLALLTGLALCLLPWLALQKLAFGKASLLVDRVSQYNLFVGNDVDELGWLSVPYPDLTGIEKDKHTDILKHAMQKSPERFLKLMLDKPARLLKLPWNDFRAKIGPIPLNAQTVFHQLILALAAIGIITAFSDYQQFQRPKILARLSILFVGLFHLVYLFFITVPRYGLTAMPELILFSAVGLGCLITAGQKYSTRLVALRAAFATALLLLLSQASPVSLYSTIGSNSEPIHFWLYLSIILKLVVLYFFLLACWRLAAISSITERRYALICICLIVLLVAPAYCLPIRANGRWYEWSKNFQQSGTQIQRIINLNKNQISQFNNSQSFLALNIEGGSNLATDWNILVNDHKLTGPFIPALALAQDFTLVHKDNNNYSIEQESIVKCLCNVTSLSPLDLRQWYLIPLNAKELQLTSITSLASIRVLVQKNTNSVNTIYGAYRSSENFSIIPSLFRFSWEKTYYGVENSNGLTDPAYDQKIESPAKANLAGPYIKLLIPINSTPKIVQQKNSFKSPGYQLNLLQSENKNCNFSSKEYALFFKPQPTILPNNGKNTAYWLVRLSGQIHNISSVNNKIQREKENNRDQRLILWPSLNFSAKTDRFNSKNNTSYISPWLPNYLKSQGNGQPLHFDICFPILINAFNKPLNTIELHFLKNASSGQVEQTESRASENMHLESFLQIYQMNKLPSETQYEII